MMDDNGPKRIVPTGTTTPAHRQGKSAFYCSSCGIPLDSSQIGGSCLGCGAPVSASLNRTKHPAPASAIASMVLGIASIVTCILWGIPAVICGTLAVILAGMAERKVKTGAFGQQSKNMIATGRVCGWIGISLGSLFILGMVVYWIFLGLVFLSILNSPTMTPPPPTHNPYQSTPHQVTPSTQLSPTPGAPTIDGPEESSDDTPDPNPDALPIEPESESRPAP